MLRCHMKFINDDEHIKNDFGYNRLNERYKQCVRCRTKRTEYREAHRDELREKQKEYYYEHKEELNKKKMEYDKVYHSEKIECSICGNTMTRKTMFKHRVSPSCKAIANVCKYYTEMLDDKHKDDIYSLGKTKLKRIIAR